MVVFPFRILTGFVCLVFILETTLKDIYVCLKNIQGTKYSRVWLLYMWPEIGYPNITWCTTSRPFWEYPISRHIHMDSTPLFPARISHWWLRSARAEAATQGHREFLHAKLQIFGGVSHPLPVTPCRQLPCRKKGSIHQQWLYYAILIGETMMKQWI